MKVKAVVKRGVHIVLLGCILASTANLSAMGSLPASDYHNPIFQQENLADPHILKHQGKYYLYGTYLDGSIKGGSDHYDVYVSDDMETWDVVPNIFAKDATTLWAPDVFYDSEREQFYLYYSLEMNIGVAISDSPTGPFVDQGILIEQAIDAHMYKDENGYYLYFASVEIDDEYDMILRFILGVLTGSGDKAKEEIWVQPMQSPTEIVGNPELLLQPTEQWEKGLMLDVNEGPWMFKEGETYYLMYSGSEAMFGNYAIGYATSDNPMGPFEKYENNPIVQRQPASIFKRGIFSPGHHSVLTDDDGRHWMFYHQKRTAAHIGFSDRFVCKDEMNVNEWGELHVEATPMKKL